jgi:formamidopyrimidine-DNA glycosylase
MPELPDVENVVNKIKPQVVGRAFKDVEILDPLLLQTSPSKLRKTLIESRVEELERKGKFILFYLTPSKTLILHLRMTGSLLWFPTSKERHPHDRIIFFFEHGEMHFRDQRRLGKVYLVPNRDFSSIKTLSTMGPEPFSPSFTFTFFDELLRKRKGKIKSLLMDQSFVAGIGNIYGDEILFQAKIRPTRRAEGLKEEEKEVLFKKIREVLLEAVAHYEQLSEKSSWFINWRRKGVCPRGCGRLERVKIGGRYSYFCPSCQK